MVAKTCYLCGSNNIASAFRKFGYDILRCQECQLHYLDFRKDYTTFTKNFYEEGYFEGDKRYAAYVHYTEEKSIILRSSRPILRQAKNLLNQQRINGNPPTLLDVGCAAGFMMEEAQKLGFDVFGIDPSLYMTLYAKKRFGNRVERVTLGQKNPGKKTFDVVTMFDVFEHLRDPRSDLKKIHTMLRDSGVLVVKTGDQGSLMARLMGQRWYFYNPPQHLFHMNLAQIKEVLRQAGFVVIQTKQEGKWFELGYVLHIARTSGQSRLAESLFHLIEKTRISKIPIYLKFFGNIVIYARKNENA